MKIQKKQLNQANVNQTAVSVIMTPIPVHLIQIAFISSIVINASSKIPVPRFVIYASIHQHVHQEQEDIVNGVIAVNPVTV